MGFHEGGRGSRRLSPGLASRLGGDCHRIPGRRRRGRCPSIMHYLEVTQEADGHWPQNMWMDGRAYWSGLQMDETAFPILLVDALRREAPFVLGDLKRWWQVVKRAAGFLLRNGPVTQQDRWEEDAGYSPFTLAVEVSSLLAAADLGEVVGEKDVAQYLREIADCWNDNIERWVYATKSELAKQMG